MKQCPYCNAPLVAETPCLAHPPVPMSYWPKRSEVVELAPEVDEVPEAMAQRAS